VGAEAAAVLVMTEMILALEVLVVLVVVLMVLQEMVLLILQEIVQVQILEEEVEAVQVLLALTMEQVEVVVQA
jgi:hypothetical protein